MHTNQAAVRLDAAITATVLDTRRRLTILLWAYDASLLDARQKLGLETVGSDPVTFMLHQRVKRFMPADAALVDEVHALVSRDPVEVLRSVEGFISEAEVLH